MQSAALITEITNTLKGNCANYPASPICYIHIDSPDQTLTYSPGSNITYRITRNIIEKLTTNRPVLPPGIVNCLDKF